MKQFLGMAPKKVGNQLIISCEKLERRVALLEDGVLEEYNIERDTDRNIVGSIFKGKVKNIEHGLKAMFVDIGFEKINRFWTFGLWLLLSFPILVRKNNWKCYTCGIEWVEE